MSTINYTGTYTDLYQLTMAQVYFLEGRRNEQAVFDYSFRKLPFKGGYVVFAGLSELLDILEELTFSEEDLTFLRDQGFYSEFLEYLKDFRFQGNVFSFSEGDVVFPNEPILQVEGTLIEVQLVETLLLNTLNYYSLVATKASRMRAVAGDRTLIDFGLRRSHGPAGYYAVAASVIGGFDATSFVRAGNDFDIPVSGTMAHSFIQSYEDELTAFREYADIWKDQTVLLVDTYDTLQSGVPHAITVGHELQEKGHHLKGIRLDSGDLAYLAKKSRKMLDEAGLNDVKIAASNQLDEYVIKSLLEQGAPIDLFGVGTSLVTGQPDAALDGVYKLSLVADRPSIKLSETMVKTTLPHKKQVYRMLDDAGNYLGIDAICLREEHEIKTAIHPFEPHKSTEVASFVQKPMLQYAMKSGRRQGVKSALRDIGKYSRQQLTLLPDEYRRFENPHTYKIGVGEELLAERNRLVDKYSL